jgi:class 3 adenylate cyclase
MFTELIDAVAPTLHERFARRCGDWREEWRRRGHASASVGLGVGISFGPATIGFIGPAGKKQFGVIGEPVNVAVLLCSAAEAGTALVEHEAFARAGCTAPPAPLQRLRSKKPHQRIAALCLRCGPERGATRFGWLLPAARADE